MSGQIYPGAFTESTIHYFDALVNIFLSMLFESIFAIISHFGSVAL